MANFIASDKSLGALDSGWLSLMVRRPLLLLAGRAGHAFGGRADRSPALHCTAADTAANPISSFRALA